MVGFYVQKLISVVLVANFQKQLEIFRILLCVGQIKKICLFLKQKRKFIAKHYQVAIMHSKFFKKYIICKGLSNP